MKKIYCMFVIMLMLLTSPLASTLATGSSNTEPTTSGAQQYEKGYRYNAGGWVHLHIEGKPYERGYQHGYLLSDEIVDMMNRWSNIVHEKNILKRLKFDQNSSAFYERISTAWWNFARSRAKQLFWSRYPDEYKEEIQGIADGVKAQGGKIHERDIDYLDILASNEMYELMTRLENKKKAFHPLRSLLGFFKGLIPIGSDAEAGFIESFLTEEPAQNCNGFIATGDATSHGQIVTAHGILCGGWWYTYYIPQRWNVIIDIAPSEGYRFQMPSAPGYIWSDDNYYQNEKGIVLMDTTCLQGLWNNRGYPMAIRMRMGAQYSDTIDEGLYYLKYKNDGIWTAVYLLGDTKTGEIARLDLGLYNSETWRTFNGFYWTANNPINKGVRAEIVGLGLKGAAMKIISKIIPMDYGFYTRKYIPASRDLKFEEMGEKYYGEIDIELMKKIMGTNPICNNASTDAKVSDTNLIESGSIWGFFGNIRGMVWNTSTLTKKLDGVRDVPPVGWTLISGLPVGTNYQLPKDSFKLVPTNENELIWTFDFAKEFEGRNFWYANLALDDDKLFGAGSNGVVYALDANTGKKLWENLVNDFFGTTWINAKDDIVVVGWENGTRALEQDTGNIVWRNNDAKYVSSQPVFIGDMVIVGSRNGDVYALNRSDGKELWHSALEKENVYIASDTSCESNRIIVAAGNHCYAIKDGNVLWDFTADGDILCAPRVADDVIYVGSSDTHLYALDAENGEPEWDQGTGWSISTTPAIDEDAIFVGSMDNHLYAFDRDTSNMLWSFTCNAAIQSSPYVYGELVFFGSDDGRLYAVNKSSGELVWYFAPGYTIDGDVYNYIVTPVSSNSVAGDKKVFTSANGMIYGLDAQTFEKPKTADKEKETINETLFFIFIVLLLVAFVFVTAILVYIGKKSETGKKKTKARKLTK